MRAILVIARKDLRQRLRDRSAIIAGFVAPLALAFIISGAFGGGFSDSFSAHYLVLDQDGSELSRAFSEQVLRAPQLGDQVTVADVASVGAAKELLRTDEVTAAFVIGRGFALDVIGGMPASIEVLRNADAPIGGTVAEALANAYVSQINASRLAVATAIAAGDTTAVAELAQRASAERIPIGIVDGAIGVRDVSGVNYFGPAMAVFSLFFSTAFVARSLIGERTGGTLPRILAAPVPRASVALGKSLVAFVLGLSSFAVMFAIFGLVLDVTWGDPLALVVLTLAIVVAVMGLMTVTQTLARTQEGADAISSVIAIALALFGGNFFPLFQMPEAMQKISYATPNGWALRGYTDIAYDGATLGDLVPHLLAITAFAVVTLTVGLWRARRIT